MSSTPIHNEEETGLDDQPQYEKFSPHQRRVILTLVSLVSFINPLCLCFFFPTQNVIQTYFHTSPLLAILCIQIFPVCSGVFPFLMSPLSDRLGRKAVLWLCLPVFLAAQFLSPFSPNIGLLVFARALSGAAISPSIAVGTGCIYDAFPPESRSFALGLLLAPSTVGSLIGPTLGGLVTQAVGWKWAIWVPALIALPIVVSALIFLPETLDRRPSTRVGDNRLPSWNPLTPIWTYLFSRPIFWFSSARAMSMSAVLTTIPMSNYVLASYPNSFSPLLLGVTTVPFSIGAILGSVAGGKFPELCIARLGHPYAGMVPGLLCDALLSVMLLLWSNVIYLEPWVAVGLTALIGVFCFVSRTSYFATVISIKPHRASTLSALVQLETFLFVGVWSILAPLILDYFETISVVFAIISVCIDLCLLPVVYITVQGIYSGRQEQEEKSREVHSHSDDSDAATPLASSFSDTTFPQPIRPDSLRDREYDAFSPAESRPLFSSHPTPVDSSHTVIN